MEWSSALKRQIEFGSDGIRGRVGTWPFRRNGMQPIGQALGHLLSREFDSPVVVIGRDTRSSGKELSSDLIRGLLEHPVDVIDLGVITTPGVAYFTKRQGAGLGIVVSASHKPATYNGIKLLGSDGLRLQRRKELDVVSLIGVFVKNPGEADCVPGQVSEGQHLIEFYIQEHVQLCPAHSLEGLKVMLDCANGATSYVAPEAFRRLGAKVVAIHNGADGSRINSGCGSEFQRAHRARFAKAVRSYGADYGFAFDGDGDRLVVVDQQGHLYDGDDILFLLARYFQSTKRLRGNTVVITDVANRGLAEALDASGIQTLYADHGDMNLEAAIWGGDFMLGGEPGGNIIINDNYHTAADATYTAIVLCSMLYELPEDDMASLAAPWWDYRRPRIQQNVVLPTRLSVNEKRLLEDRIIQTQTMLDMDSRVMSWESRTEPGVWRIIVEGSRQTRNDQLQSVMKEARSLVRHFRKQRL